MPSSPIYTNNPYCDKCGLPRIAQTDGTSINPPICKCHLIKQNEVPQVPLSGVQGWICPVCGSGNSPYSLQCPCNAKPFKVTC